MSHQPFEAWILDNEPLSTEERRTLQAHLATCGQCQRLERRWQAVHQELRGHRMVAPALGFTQRWVASLAERKIREQRKQAWRIFVGLLGGALFILLVLGSYTMATTTPSEWLASLVRMASSSTVFVEYAVFVVQSWLQSTPRALHIALWMYLTLTLCALTLTWVLIFWRTKSVGVLNQ